MSVASTYRSATFFCRRLLGLVTLVCLCSGVASGLTLSGTVFNDPDALTNAMVDGTGTDGGGLYVNLLDETNTVVDVATVAADGTYTFTGVLPATTYGLLLSKWPGDVGSFAPTAELNSGWIYSGEFIGAGAGDDGSADGFLVCTISADEANANFGLGKVGTLKGHIYRDDNGDGIEGGSEPSLGDIDVKITDHYGNVTVASTDFNGDWTVVIPVGSATVAVDHTDPEFPADSIQTEGVALVSTTAVFDTTTNTGKAGFFVPAIVTGHLYIDTNGNGTYDLGEPHLAGVDVNVTNANGDPLVVTTDSNGIWTAYVPEGVMVFSVDQTDADFTAKVNGDFTQTEGQALSILFASKAAPADAGADGYFMPGTVTGHLYIDSNGNGHQDVGEPNLPNEQVTVTDSNGIQQTVTTNFVGVWSASVPPGTTQAKVSTTTAHFILNVPAGSTQTDGTDPNSVVAIANSSVFAGDDGYFVPGTITGHLYVDSNGSGVQDSGEPDLPAVEVIVTDSTGAVKKVKSAPNGNWQAIVTPGLATVKVNTTDPVFIAAVTNSYVQTEGTDPSTVTAVANASTFAGIDGYFIPALVTGHLYFDTNGNGSQNDGEPDLAGIDVEIRDSTGKTYTATTNSKGVWLVSITQGTTLVKVKESDPDFPTGAVITEGSDPQILTSTADATTTAGDIGYFIPATITGHLYADTNGNGVQDGGEPNIAGAEVVVTAASTATQTVTTDATGSWTAIVPPGATTAEVTVTDSHFTALVFPGYIQTQGTTPSHITATVGSAAAATPAGYFNPATVTGHLYVDSNGNGHQDNAEPNLSAVNVTVTDSNNAQHTVVTDTNGNWSLQVPPGATVAKVDTVDPDFTSVLPVGYTQSEGNDPTSFTAVAGSTVNGGVDGYKVPVLYSISGQVRFDSDRNGNFLDHDKGLAGFTLKLYSDANGSQTFNAGVDTLLAVTATATDGTYTFTGFPDGHYVVVETPVSSAFVSTNDKDGNNDRIVPVHVVNANNAGNDFLEFAGPQGWFYDTETGNVLTGGSISASTVPSGGTISVFMDGSSGEYAWATNGIPGNYTITVTAPAGYTLDPSRPASPTPLVAQGQPDPLAIGSGVNVAASGLNDFSAAANTWYLTFTMQAGDPGICCNNIPLLRNNPVSFKGWSARNPLSGFNGATDNPDGDAFSNLLEFAFGLNASSGAATVCPLQIVANGDGTIDAQMRRLTGSVGVVFDLEYISNLALSGANGLGWSVVQTISPTVVTNGDGTETATYQNLAQIPALASGQGYVRVKVTDTVSNTVSRTLTSGWSLRGLSVGIQTYGCPFLPCAIFTGAVDTATSNAVNLSAASGGQSIASLFTPGKQYYLEVISGVNTGHRWEIDEAATTGASLFIDTTSPLNTQASVPATLATNQIVVREHLTLKGLFPVAKFHATNSITSADRVLTSTSGTGAYSVYWLFNAGGHPKWVDGGNATLADVGDQVIIDNCQGVFVQPKSSAILLTQTGQVRQNALACPLKVGPNMITGGWPLDQSVTDRKMTITDGFTGNGNSQLADKIQLWTGDDTPGQQGYSGYFQFSAGSRKYLTDIGSTSLTNRNTLPIFVALRAAFVQSVAGKSNWVMPLPWTP